MDSQCFGNVQCLVGDSKLPLIFHETVEDRIIIPKSHQMNYHLHLLAYLTRILLGDFLSSLLFCLFLIAFSHELNSNNYGYKIINKKVFIT